MKLYSYYLKKLGKMPLFLDRYIYSPCLLRLKKVNYFCGMDNASKEIYDFKEKITRYDHSLSTALLTWHLTENVTATLAALFHDASTPCFSHVIDYMNKDYTKQESTEEYQEKILRNDLYLNNLLKKDNIKIEDIINFKKYSIVDNDRPKLCADRLDGIILTGISWTANLTKEDIDLIMDNIKVFVNSDKEKEIGFTSLEAGKRVLELNDEINELTHSDKDNYMMELLADITRSAIDAKKITYEELYNLNEDEVFKIFKKIKDDSFAEKIDKFRNIRLNEIEKIDIPNIKKRIINPLVNGERIIKK